MKIYITEFRHRYGTDVCANKTMAGAQECAAEQAMEWLSELDDDTAEAMTKLFGEKKYAQVVSLYNEKHSTDCIDWAAVDLGE